MSTREARGSRSGAPKLAAALLAVGLLSLSPTSARADWDWDDSSSNVGDGAGVALAVMYGIVNVTFLSADITFAVRGEYMRPGWATWQLIWGSLNVTMGLLAVPLGLYGNDRAWFRFGMTAGILGTFFLVHAAIQIKRRHQRHRRSRQPAPDEETPPPPPEENVIRIGMAPVAGGMTGAFSLTF